VVCVCSCQFKVGFARLGIECRFSSDDSPAALEALIDHNTKAIYLETIGNPKVGMVDSR
jgi:O-acetylhomoserine/O-acetylserine sulfhydrylase